MAVTHVQGLAGCMTFEQALTEFTSESRELACAIEKHGAARIAGRELDEYLEIEARVHKRIARGGDLDTDDLFYPALMAARRARALRERLAP